MNIFYFLLVYQNCIYIAMFGALAVIALVNFVHNPYAKQNVKLKRFNKKILQRPSSVVLEVKHLPAEYQRQWRAFVNSRCQKPSVVFEFVKRPQKYLLWFAHFVTVLFCVAYTVMAFVLRSEEMFAIQVAFVLFGVLVLLVTNIIGSYNLSRARRVYGKFLHDLNLVTDILKSDKNTTPPINLGAKATNSTFSPTESTIPVAEHPISQTPPQTAENEGDVIEKTVRILKQKGLDNPRTAEEQRRLNLALNNLLQACCKK